MSDTIFVTMFDPALGNAQVQAPLQAVPTYQAHGWLLLDPNAPPPPMAAPYLTQAAGDSRYVRDWAGAETLTAGAVRMAPDGHVIVRTADGTTRSSYDSTEQAAWTSPTGGGGGAVSSVVGQTGAVTGAQIAADPALRAAYASRRSNLLARLNQTPTNPVLLPSPPTITYGTSSALYSQQVAGVASVTLLGSGGTFYDAPTGKTYTGAGTVGVDFYLTGTKCEMSWISNQSNADQLWVWVDNQPVTAAPGLPLATTAGSQYVATIDFGATAARHRVTVYFSDINALAFIATTTTGVIEPTAHRTRIAFVGDSFFDSAANLTHMQTAPSQTAILLGAECIQLGVGGSGYLAYPGSDPNDTFGSSGRVNLVTAAKPDLIVISGSVNDVVTGLQAAATACYSAYATACPGVPIIVFGPQPSNAVDTVSSGRQQQIAAVKAAAIAAPNVIAFHDMVGTAAGVPAAWSSSATYNEGDLVTYLGAVWRWTNGGTAGNESSPRTALRWICQTWNRVGTGKVGTTAGDGNRDVLLYSDGVHPTALGAQADAVRHAGAILADLAS